MQSKVNQFIGKAFIKDKKTYVVERVDVIKGKAFVSTDRRTFVLYENELNDLIDSIEFVDVPQVSFSDAVPAVMMFKNDAIGQHVVQQNALSLRMTKKLEEVFDELTGAPGEETYKKAKSMVEVANSIVGVQMANYKYLTLNNR